MTQSEVTAETTIIANNTQLKGEITFGGPARVAGHVEGTIHAEDVLEITEEGTIQGDIFGTMIEIHGTIRGNVTASKTCRLSPSAKLAGELRAANLAIAEGATFVGRVYVGGEAGALEQENQQEAAEQASPAPVNFQNRMEQLAETTASAEEAVSEANGSIRVLTQNVQNSVQRQPRIIKAAAGAR